MKVPAPGGLQGSFKECRGGSIPLPAATAVWRAGQRGQPAVALLTWQLLLPSCHRKAFHQHRSQPLSKGHRLVLFQQHKTQLSSPSLVLLLPQAALAVPSQHGTQGDSRLEFCSFPNPAALCRNPTLFTSQHFPFCILVQLLQSFLG